MQTTLQMAAHPLVLDWLENFESASDKAVARFLLDQLRLVSSREFETELIRTLEGLQKRLGTTIAVYPVQDPPPDGVIGQRQFAGAVTDETAAPREHSRRRQYGSEDRVGHILQKLQVANSRPSGSSLIECEPTVTQLKTQGIKHVVLVDDLSGSGTRILKHWKRVVPKSIKGLLSLKKLELWIVLFAVAPPARAAIHRDLPRFPIDDHLLTVLPEADFNRVATPKVKELCSTYAEKISFRGNALGYKDSFCPIVFEHGCPNNVPPILWAMRPRWRPLFPGGSVPAGLRDYFDDNGAPRELEQLWRVNQPSLALALLDSLSFGRGLTDDQRRLLIFLGMRNRGVPEDAVFSRLQLVGSDRQRLLELAVRCELYDADNQVVTGLGRNCVSFYSKEYRRKRPLMTIARSPTLYYPPQCEGKFRALA